MSVTLRDIIFPIRSKIGELIPNYWYQGTLIEDVNRIVQELCSEAQCLETAVQINWAQGEQEYPLPLQLENILNVGVYQGQFFELDEMDDASHVKQAGRTLGIPAAFYTSTQTTVLSPQGTAGNPTGNIVLVELSNPPEQTEACTVIGLWPIPSQAIPVTIWATRFHKFVKDPQNLLQIPRRFAQTVIDGALVHAYEHAEMTDMAQYYQGKYDKGKQEFVNYWINRRQLKGFPSYGANLAPSFTRGAIIVVDQNPGLYNQ
jgi:hypothetical protein